MDITVIGTSYKSADISYREKFSFSDEEISLFLPKLVLIDGVLEAMLLSTCNRTEIYIVREEGLAVDQVLKALAEFKGETVDLAGGLFYLYEGNSAIKHLFRVAASLESQMVGENQIKGQIRDAYKKACAVATNGRYLNRLMHKAFQVSKKVQTNTNLGEGAVSISSAAIELAEHIFETLATKSVLLVGAGETAELALKHMLAKGVGIVSIANRTGDNAKKLAAAYGGDVVDFEKIGETLFDYDLVILATSSSDYVVKVGDVEAAYGSGRQKRLVIIDVAVPRNADPEIAKFEGIYLYDIDNLKTVVEKNLQERNAEVPFAEKIVLEAAARFEKWMKEQKVVPTIKQIQERFEALRVKELERNKHCATCSKRAELDMTTKSIISKILMSPISKLTRDTGCSEDELEYLREMFIGDSGEE